MALADFDATATARRIRDIADAARKAFEAHVEGSALLDAAAREAAAKEEADRTAARERRAAAEARAGRERPAAPPEQPKTRPATLSLGAEEFKLDREARRAQAPEPEPPRPGRTLKLGARDDEAVERDKPVRKRPPAREADDDMSGRTWLR